MTMLTTRINPFKFFQQSRIALSIATLGTAVGLLLTSSISYAEVQELNGRHYVKTDRYTLVSMETKPEQYEPLLAIVDIQFSQDIRSVGTAIEELLVGSGYRWNSKKGDNPDLNKLPLPMVVRQIGPVRLRDALITIAGSAWTLKTDEATRQLWFERQQPDSAY